MMTDNKITKTKVWICAADNGGIVRDSVNEFIKDKKVIDIKYQALFNHGTNNINDRALVVYVEQEEGDE